MRMLSRSWITLALLGLVAIRAMGAEAVPPPVEFRLKHGDDPRWSAPDWDDSTWEIAARSDGRTRTPLDFVPARTGIFWIRYQVERSTLPGLGLNAATYLWPRDEPGAPINSVFFPGTLCYEFFWDGRLIGRSGVVGASREAEVPGTLDNLMLIPDSLLGSGPHQVALRVSTYHYNFPSARFRISPTLGNYAARLNYEARQAIVPLIGATGAALAALVCVLLFWFVDRRRPVVICGLLSFAVALLFTLIAWRWLHQDPYTWLYPRYQAMLLTMAAIGVLMIWLLVEQFGISRRRWWVLGGTLVIMAVVLNGTAYHQLRVLWMGRAMLGYALLLVAWAVGKKRPGARFALVGVLLGLVSVQQATDIRAVVSPAFFLFFGGLVLTLLGVLGWQIRADREHARAAQLAAARLETELLKKNIQPHFLLNTLAVLTEIVEQDPPRAVKLIEDLADEFRTVARVSAEKLIPLEQELGLCRAHLRVMSVRTGRSWTLKTAGLDSATFVPPAIFLTLIENGFAHQRADSEAATFRLAMENAAEGARRWVFFSPGGVQTDPARPAGGTGLRYVKARLEESFPGQWTLADGPVEGGWRTVIEIGRGVDGGLA